MSEVRTLNAEIRERAGKGVARALRREGRVPAVIYGNRQNPVMISLDVRDVVKEINQPGFFAHIYEVEAGGKKHRCLARDISFHPVTDVPEHLDFLRVSKKTQVSVAVPVRFINEEESAGLTKGGVLNIVRHELELNCGADNIPEIIEIDLAGFDLGDSIHMSAVTLPDGVEPTITDRDFTIATIAASSGAKAEAQAEAAEGEETAEDEEAAEGENGES